MEHSKVKRIRSANYTIKEKELLVNLAVKYKHVMENKIKDAVSVGDKSKTWQKIANEYSIAPNRSVNSLKKFYENIKKDLRRKIGDYKERKYITGGGSPPILNTEATDDLQLQVVSEKTVFGLEDPFDSDKSNSLSPMLSQHLNQTATTSTSSCDEFLSMPFIEPNNVELIEMELGENIEIISSNELANGQFQVSGTSKSSCASYKFSDLKKPLTECLKRPSQSGKAEIKNKTPKEIASRRHPHSTIKILSASTLHDKYEALVDEKLVNEDFLKHKAQLEMECLRREHDLKVTILNLDIEMKKKAVGSFE